MPPVRVTLSAAASGLAGLEKGSADLVYADPPAFTGRNWGEFDDRWESLGAYLEWSRKWIAPAFRTLRKDGSFYLHTNPVVSHYLKTEMDGMCGPFPFRNEIVWRRHHSHPRASWFGAVTDRILLYSARPVNREAIAEAALEPASSNNVLTDRRGGYYLSFMCGAGLSKGRSGGTWRGWSPAPFGKHWSVPKDEPGTYGEWIADNIIPRYRHLTDIFARLDALAEADMIVWTARGNPKLKRYLAACRALPPSDLWDDIPPLPLTCKERTGYPTQKPEKLLERVIAASARPSGLVVDPFCGSGTTLAVAKKLGRAAQGFDINPRAVKLARVRLAE